MEGGALSLAAWDEALLPLPGLSDFRITLRGGETAVASKAFGLNGATRQLLKLLAANPVDDAYPSYFLYTDRPEKKEELLPLLRQEGLLPSRLHDCAVGAAIGTHAGPGAFGFAYVEKA